MESLVGTPLIDVFSLAVVVLYILNGLTQLLLAVKLHRRFIEHSFATSISTVILWFFAAFAYPFLLSKAEGALSDVSFNAFLWIVIITPLLIFAILFYQFIILRKKPELRLERQPENLKDRLKNKADGGSEYDFGVDLKRKLFHLVPALLIIGLYHLGIIIKDVQMSYHLMITVGYSGIFVFAVLDLIRFSWLFGTTKYYELLPSKIFSILTQTMKPKELVEFIKACALILAMVPILFFDFGVFASTALIATVGDGCASIFGKLWGRKQWPKNSPKTVVGYIAGILASFGITLTCLLVYQPDYSLMKVFTLAISAGFFFFMVDLSNSKIDDNILNSIVVGSVLGFLSIIL